MALAKKKEKYYKILIDARAKAPEIRTATVKLEKIPEEQKKEFEETRAENRGKTAWLMPSGSIFWAGAGMEINGAKKILQKEGKAAKAKKAKTAKKKVKKKAKKRK